MLLWHYIFHFVSYRCFDNTPWMTFYSQGGIYLLLLYFWTCAFSDMHGPAIFTLHGYRYSALG